MPIITMCAPIARARSSASLRLARSSASSSAAAVPASAVGRTLISMLNWPISVWKTSSAIAASTSALRIAGSCWASTRLNSISSAGQRPLEVELRLAEHPGEHVQAAPQLLPVAQPVLAGERPGLDLFAHAGRLPSVPPVRSGWHRTGRATAERVAPCPGPRCRGAVRVRVTAGRRKGNDVKVTDSWYSERLEQPIGLARWGHYGTPVLVFPTAGGDAEEIERNGLVGACWPLIESGRVKLYSCDSVAGQAMVAKAGSPEYRMWLFNQFHHCRPARGRAGDPGRHGRRRRRRSSRPARRSGRSTRSRCSAGSRTCSAPPSA